MSGPGYIQEEGNRKCQFCGKTDECRPYGHDGEDICFECVIKNPAETKKQFAKRLFGIDDAK
jgi:hypothetical protein